LASYNSVTCNSSKTERFDPNRFISMRLRPKYPQLANVVFLDKVAETLRSLTSGITEEELPEEIQLLLRKLEEQERGKNEKEPPEAWIGLEPCIGDCRQPEYCAGADEHGCDHSPRKPVFVVRHAGLHPCGASRLSCVG